MECFPLIKLPTPVPVSYYASCKRKTTTPASLIVARPPSLARPPPSHSLPTSFPSCLPHSDQTERSPLLASFHSFLSTSCCFPRPRRRRRSIHFWLVPLNGEAFPTSVQFLPSLPFLPFHIRSLSLFAQWSAISKRVFDRTRVAWHSIVQRVMCIV